MKRFWIGLSAALVFALCATGTVWIIRYQIRARAIRAFVAAGPANLAREQAAARAAGIPLDPKQLQQPLPPPAQNAAPDYVRLTKLLHDKPLHLPKYAEGMDAFHSYTPAQIAAARKILAERQDVMTLVHQATDKPKCVFVRDWNKELDPMFPEYQTIRMAARLLKTESYLLARNGHYQEAVKNQSLCFRVAKHADSDHMIIGHLEGIACDALAFSGMKSILAQAGPDGLVDSAVEKAVGEEYARLSLRAAMAGEANLYSAYFMRMHRADREGLSAALAAGGFSEEVLPLVQPFAGDNPNLPALIDAWEADYLARMLPLVVAGDQTPPARRAAYASAEHSMHIPNDAAPTVHVFSDILVPVLTKMDQNDTRTQAHEAVTLAAAAVLAERAKSGAYPSSLPPRFTDPYTGKPLQYRREGTNGFVVYSAGSTGHFDGGKPGQKVPATESLFRYPAVPLPAGGS